MELSTKKNTTSMALANTNGHHGQRDQDIITARRVDWRFLLPFPMLRNVVYIGPESNSLPAALKKFSSNLTAISPVDLQKSAARLQNRFDLAVVHSTDRKLIRSVISMIAPGGLLYWEVDRRQKKKIASALPLRSAEIYAADLRRLYMKDVELHWHRPDFDTCLEIIPMTPVQALKKAFSKSHTSWKGRLKIAAGRLMMQSGLLMYTAPCFSLVARKKN